MLRAVVVFCCLSVIWCTQFIARQASSAQTNPAPAPTEPLTIKVDVNAVLVPVVVRDMQGHAVGNLQKEDFEVFDQGKRQVIGGFTIEKRAARAVEVTPTVLTALDPRIPVFVNPAPRIATQRFIVFLFDDLHLSFADLAQVQSAAKRMLGGSLGDSDMADVVSFSGTNSGMTRDRAKLQEAILQLKVRNLYRQGGRQCPNIDYYLGDLIVNKHNEQATESAVQDTMACANMKPEMRNLAENIVRSSALQALAMGDHDVRLTLGFVKDLVRRMETLPGERMLILVSPGFVAISGEAMALKSEIMDLAAQSQVTISALDARGLYTTNLDASQHGDASAFGTMTGQESQHHSESMSLNDDVMAELADGTGGTFFHNSNDLEGGFKRLTEAPEYVYLLEFSPQKMKPNGSSHSLKVKVRQGGLKVQARQRYYAPKDENGKK
jgi:VWFA-related protein